MSSQSVSVSCQCSCCHGDVIIWWHQHEFAFWLLSPECKVRLSIWQTSLCPHWSPLNEQSVYYTGSVFYHGCSLWWGQWGHALVVKYWATPSFWHGCWWVNISSIHEGYLAGRARGFRSPWIKCFSIHCISVRFKFTVSYSLRHWFLIPCPCLSICLSPGWRWTLHLEALQTDELEGRDAEVVNITLSYPQHGDAPRLSVCLW